MFYCTPFALVGEGGAHDHLFAKFRSENKALHERVLSFLWATCLGGNRSSQATAFECLARLEPSLYWAAVVEVVANASPLASLPFNSPEQTPPTAVAELKRVGRSFANAGYGVSTPPFLAGKVGKETFVYSNSTNGMAIATVGVAPEAWRKVRKIRQKWAAGKSRNLSGWNAWAEQQGVR